MILLFEHPISDVLIVMRCTLIKIDQGSCKHIISL